MENLLQWFIVEGGLDIGRLVAVALAGVISLAIIVLVRTISRSERGKAILQGQDILFNQITTFVVRAEEMWRNNDFDADDELAERANENGRDIRLQWVLERSEEFQGRYLRWLPLTTEEFLSLIQRGVRHFDSFRGDTPEEDTATVGEWPPSAL